jgi:hypothetical protein
VVLGATRSERDFFVVHLDACLARALPSGLSQRAASSGGILIGFGSRAGVIGHNHTAIATQWGVMGRFVLQSLWWDLPPRTGAKKSLRRAHLVTRPAELRRLHYLKVGFEVRFSDHPPSANQGCERGVCENPNAVERTNSPVISSASTPCSAFGLRRFGRVSSAFPARLVIS